MVLVELKKDLFTVDINKYVFAHCVSADLELGKGIAKQFKNRYPNLKKFCLKQNSQIGNVIRFVEDIILFNLITKEFYWQKPTYLTIKQTLIKLKKNMVYTNEKYLAIPLIGCGLDKLNWEKVKMIIKDIFNDTDIEILVCIL